LCASQRPDPSGTSTTNSGSTIPARKTPPDTGTTSILVQRVDQPLYSRLLLLGNRADPDLVHVRRRVIELDLLVRLLMPRLAPGARIVITSSGTHDPAEKTGVPPPRHADAQKLAFPEQDEALDPSPIAAGMRAYSTSKLCNLLTAKALAQSAAAQDQNWQVFAYDPGLTPGTGLARDQPWVVRHLIWPLLPLFVPFAKTMNRLSDAGRGLSDLATVTSPPTGRIYAALRKGKLTWPDPSTLAQDKGVMQKLWADSATLVQLPD
jgi:hypothetical protein